jgi:hypothetical protein
MTLAAGLGAFGSYWYYLQEPEVSRVAESAVRDSHVAPQLTTKNPDEPSKVIYLNREGAVLTAGVDDARKNQSSIVKNSGKSSVLIPAFVGTAKQWESMVQCVREKFAPFDVAVVERRPTEGSYIMVAVGGRAQELGLGATGQGDHDHSHEVTGLAPFNSKTIGNAVVLVFSRSLREDPRRICETAAMEIAHAFGLDHTRSCQDLMSYTKPCGSRRFVSQDLACGEHVDRLCDDGKRTQNSHGRLLEVLGPSGGATRASR